MPPSHGWGRPRSRFHGCLCAFSRFFTRCVKAANPRGAWLCGLRAAPVSVLRFACTETGAGSFLGHFWSTKSCSRPHGRQCLTARCWQLDSWVIGKKRMAAQTAALLETWRYSS